MGKIFNSIVVLSSKAGNLGLGFTRFACALVLIWIGGLKFVSYEADGITPFVANSPFMSFFYSRPQEYKTHGNKEGELIKANRQWNEKNNTYGFGNSLGMLLIGIAILLLLGYWNDHAGFFGSMLLLLMSVGTLSFLVTTPESWVPNLGDGAYGFPYLSGRGRLVIKDVIMLGAAIILLSEAAKGIIRKERKKVLGY